MTSLDGVRMNIGDVLKEIILDFQARTLENSVPRRLRIDPVPGKAAVCLGVRRSGKSTFLFQIVQALYGRGIKPQNVLYVNFFDDRLHELTLYGPAPVLEAYFSLFPEKKGTETVYCFFDEIQMVKDWEPFVDRLLRTERCEVYLTGSSARLLSREMATQMRGRSLSWELFPFSFAEFLDFKGIQVHPETGRNRLLALKAFEEYWQKGGFPEARNVPDRVRVMIHQDYFRTMVYRDIVERHDAMHPQSVMDLAFRLVNNVAASHSVNSLTGYLRALNHKVSKSFVGECLEWLEDAFFLFSVKIWDASLARQNVNAKKVYCIDHAMVTSVCPGILVNSGHLLENLIFLHLRRQTERIYYYRTQNGREVDFIWQDASGKRHLAQVCESMAAHPETQRREVTALTEAMQEMKLTEGIIVTRSESQELKTPSGRITVMPAWKFLLS